jgi:hypothetical protein
VKAKFVARSVIKKYGTSNMPTPKQEESLDEETDKLTDGVCIFKKDRTRTC